MTTAKTRLRKRVDEISDWKLVLIVGHWSHSALNLTRPQANALYKVVWAESDGYGEKGYIPAQGYDWSGIRDSSAAAKKAMADAARAYLARQGIASLLWEEGL